MIMPYIKGIIIIPCIMPYFNEFQVGGYVAYDVLLLLELDGGETLSNLTLLRGSLEPNGCSSGDEEFTIGINSVTLSKFLVTCRAELSFTAVVGYSTSYYHHILHICISL
jgi:hypothetical protein